MAARSKRSADERRLAQLREIANEGANRNCLECHQRGPTYVDMTIGSFVCTKCCGLLRGLNPPHRTKSITMTSFSDDELEFIKNRGNEFNRYVYLGTYDERSNLEKESLREEHKIREFMVQKYERKRWFVDPDIAQHKMQLDRRQRAAAEQGVSLTGGSISKPSSKPPATFATRSQPVTPAGGELWSPPPTKTNPVPAFAAFGTTPPPSQQQTALSSNTGFNAFSDDLFAMCKEAIPPPSDPFQPSSISKDQQQQIHRSFRHSNNASAVSSSATMIADPFGAPSTSSFPTPAALDPFVSPTSGVAVTAPTPGVILAPPPAQGHATPCSQQQKQYQAVVSAAPAKSSTGDFADFDAAFGSTNSSEFGSVLASASTMSLVSSPANAKTTPAVTGTTIATRGMTESGDSGTNPAFTGASSKNEVSAGAPSADRYAALAELDELFSGQKNESVSKPNELASVAFSSTDPWGNHQPAPVAAPVNPFSPTGPTAPSTSGSNNPWGSPAAPGSTPAPASSPNPFAMAANSWSATAPRASPASTQPMTLGRLTPSNATAQSSNLAAFTTGMAGIQLNNGRVTPTMRQWPTSNQSSSNVLGSGGLTGTSAQPANSGGFPAAWGAAPLASQSAFPQTQQQQFGIGTPSNPMATRSNSTSSSCSGTGSISGRANSTQGGDWAAFGQLAWSNGTTTSAGGELPRGWPNGAANAGLAEVWPQMPTSASTPAFNARSHSPAQQNTTPAINKVSGGVPQSFSVHSAFGTAQWPPNGTPNGAHQTGLSNGRPSSTANPFSPNGSGPLSAARVCSTSNPFL